MTAHATVRVERNPPVGQAIEKGLRDMLWVNALVVLLQFRYDLAVVVSFGNICVSLEGAQFRVLRSFPKPLSRWVGVFFVAHLCSGGHYRSN